MQINSLKKASFYLVLIALPFIILLLIELILRLCSFGHEYPLFVDVKEVKNSKSAVYLQPNPKVINRYFADEKLAPKVSPDTVFFKKYKSKNSFRIFIQGGSTAAGFPYGRWGSLQGLIEQRFKRLYPDKEIEIINTAMAAVNSYTLLDFVDEIIAQQPDLILIYAGHNEYLGIMGVGSAFATKGGRLATLLHLKFKNWRLYQLMQSLYYAVMSPDNNAVKSDKTLMAQVAREKEISVDSALYQQGIVQFSENMSLILQKYQARNIPVIIGNLVSNESGQLPFSTIGEIDWATYKNNLSVSLAPKKIAHLQQALAQEKTAENYFKLALNFQLLQQNSKAKNAFFLAKDYDLLRFRAPSEFNAIIESLAKKYEALFVDNQADFTANSPQGIIDNKLILEHLHPTIDGYFLLAESYVNMINNKQLLGIKSQYYSRIKAHADIPVSRVDKLYGDFIIDKLINDFPFTDVKKSVDLPDVRVFEKQALIKRINKGNWLEIQQDLLIKYQQKKEIFEAAKIAGSVSTAMIDNHQASYVAGQLYQQLKDWQLASFYHRKAVKTQADNVTYLLALAQDYFFMKKLPMCLTFLQKAQALTPDSSQQKQQISTYINSVKKALAQLSKAKVSKPAYALDSGKL